MTQDWYAPNQQAVRGDGSGPAEVGEGGSPPLEGPHPPKDEAEEPVVEDAPAERAPTK